MDGQKHRWVKHNHSAITGKWVKHNHDGLYIQPLIRVIRVRRRIPWYKANFPINCVIWENRRAPNKPIAMTLNSFSDGAGTALTMSRSSSTGPMFWITFLICGMCGTTMRRPWITIFLPCGAWMSIWSGLAVRLRLWYWTAILWKFRSSMPVPAR